MATPDWSLLEEDEESQDTGLEQVDISSPSPDWGALDNDVVKLNVNEASKTNPDKFKEVNDLSKDTGLPFSVVESNTEQVKQKVQRNNTDIDRIRATNPALFNYLKKRENALMSGDDIDSMSSLEDIVKSSKDYFQDIGDSFNQGQRVVRMGELGFQHMIHVKGLSEKGLSEDQFTELTDLKSKHFKADEDTGFVAGIPLATSEQIPILFNLFKGALDETAIGVTTGTAVGGAGGALVAGVGAIPGAISGAVFGANAGFQIGKASQAFELEGGNAMVEFMDMEGINQEMAGDAAIAVGAVNAGLELVSLGFLGQTLTPVKRLVMDRFKRALGTQSGREVIKSIAGRYAAAVAAESTTEFFQEMSNVFAGELLTVFGDDNFNNDQFTDVLADTFHPENVDRMREAGIKGLQGSIGIAGGTTVISTIVESNQRKLIQADEQKRIDEVASVIQESKTAERDPELIKQYMQEINDTHGGDDTVYINPQNLNKEDVQQFEGQGSAYDIILEQFDEAKQSGSDIVVPLSDFSAHVMWNNDAYSMMRDDIRLSNETLTNNESKQQAQDDIDKLQKIIDDAEITIEEQKESQLIWEDIQQQLIDTGRLDEKVAGVSAQLIPQRVTAFAARNNLSVREVYQRMGVEIIGPDTLAPTEGQTFNQDPFFEQTAFKQVQPGERLVYMSPDEFSSLAEPLPEGESLSETVGEDLIKDLPFLIQENGQIVNHEGRRRAELLRERGAEQIPVRVINKAESPLPRTLVGKDGISSFEIPLDRSEEVVKSDNQDTKIVNSMGMFSSLTEAARNLKQAKGKPEQMLAAIKKTGIKEDEVKWTGLEDWLGTIEGSVTKDEIVRYLEANGVNVDVIVADERPIENDFGFNWEHSIWEDPEAWEHLIEGFIDEIDNNDQVDWFDWGYWRQNNSEIIKDKSNEEIRGLADGDIRDAADAQAREEYLENPYTIDHDVDTDIYIFGNDDIGYQITTGAIGNLGTSITTDVIYSFTEAEVHADGYARENGLFEESEQSETTTWWGDIVTHGEFENYREEKIVLPDISPTFSNDTHFNDDNIVAFLRVTDRAPNGNIDEIISQSEGGKKGLHYFIDEFQSDWHQQGRRFGYVTDEEQATREGDIQDLEFNKLPELDRQLYEGLIKERQVGTVSKVPLPKMLDNIGGIGLVGVRVVKSDILRGDTRSKAEIEAVEKWLLSRGELGKEALNTINNIIRLDENIPDAPFKGDNWIRLGLKRALLQAIDNDYDALSWADSEVIADRWSDRYIQLYKNQYDNKMVKIVKKLTGVQPEHLTLDENVGPDIEGMFDDISYWSIPLTPELKERIRNERLSLFQNNRGSITFTDNTSVIQLTEASDLSTFLHEAGHLFLQMEMNIANPDGSVTPDQRSILNFLGVNSFNEIGTQQHEKWARGFEAYLMEGKAPSVELLPAFRRFKEWLMHIYRSFEGLKNAAGQDITLTDDIRSVMDRMIATDEQIAEVQFMNEYEELFKSAGQGGMTDNEFVAYRDKAEKAKEKPKETLSDKIFKQLKRSRSKWYNNVKKDLVERNIDQLEQESPVYRAEKYLKMDVQDNEVNKINKTILKEMYDGKIPRKLYGVSSDDSPTHPDELADLFGFTDGKDMLDLIIETPAIKQKATELAEAELIETYGDVLNDGSIREEAQAAAHDEERGELLLTELRVLARANNTQASDKQVIKQKAIEVITNTPIGQLRPEKHRKDEIRAAVNAQKAMNAGDVKAAHEFKRQQVVHFYLYQQSRDVKDKSESIRNRQQKMSKRKYNTKKVHPDYISNMKVLLSAFDFRKSSKDDRETAKFKLKSVNEFIKNQIEHEENPAPLVSHSAIEEIKHWTELTFSELEGIDNVAKSLRHVGGLMSEEGKERFVEKVTTIADSVRETFKNQKPEPDKGTLKQKSKDFWKSYASGLFLHADQQLRRLDGYKDGGPAFTEIKQKIDKAITEVLLPSQEKADKELYAIYKKYYPKKTTLRGMNDVKAIPNTDKRLSKWEVISLGLNWGNLSSREAVLEGQVGDVKQWTEESVKRTLDTLDKNDWEFIQEMFDYINSYWSDMAALEKKRKGVVPPRVEAAPIETKYGVFRGGYYPLKYDKKKSKRVSDKDTEDLMKRITQTHGANAATKDGMTKERVGSGKQPVDLNIMNLHNHVAEVLRLLALTEPVAEVNGILKSKIFISAMEETQNKEVVDALQAWLQDAAVGEIILGDAVNNMFRRLRVGFSVSKIGWNVGTMLVQPLGLSGSIPTVGGANILKAVPSGLVSLATNKGVVAKIHEQSAFMRERSSTFNKDIKDSLNTLRGTNFHPTYVPEWFSDSLFAGIVYLQRFVDTTVWLAAYEQGKATFDNEADLVQHADRQVARTQASGIFSDRTPIERGTSVNARQSEYIRMWSALGSYFFAKGNIAHELVTKTDLSKPTEAGKLVVDMMILYSLEAIIVAALRNMLPDEDDDESLAVAMLKESGLSVMGSFPGVREIAGASQGFGGGSTLSEFITQVGAISIQADQGELDLALFKAINSAGGMWFRYPSSAINRAVDSYVKDVQGEDIAPIDYLMYRKKD